MLPVHRVPRGFLEVVERVVDDLSLAIIFHGLAASRHGHSAVSLADAFEASHFEKLLFLHGQLWDFAGAVANFTTVISVFIAEQFIDAGALAFRTDFLFGHAKTPLYPADLRTTDIISIPHIPSIRDHTALTSLRPIFIFSGF